MSNGSIFGNSHSKPIFSSPTSSPWNEPRRYTDSATKDLPRNTNKYTKYHGVQAPYDTKHDSTRPPEPKTRFGRTVHKDTRHLITPNEPSSPSYSKDSMQRPNGLLSAEERAHKQKVNEARLARRRRYANHMEEHVQQREEQAQATSDSRLRAKAAQRNRYEKVFETQNQRYRNRPVGRKAYDKNMSIEQMRAITRR